jgi:hypothetical protein
MLVASAANNYFFISENGGRIERVDRMMIWKSFRSRIDSPEFFTGDAIAKNMPDEFPK